MDISSIAHKFIEIKLSRSKQIIKIPTQKPKDMPLELKNYLTKINLKDLRMICDSWQISRKNATKTKCLRNVITDYFTTHNMSSKMDLIKSFMGKDIQKTLSSSTNNHEGYQESFAIILIYCKMFTRYKNYNAFDPSSFNTGYLRQIKSLDKFFRTSTSKTGGGSASDILLVDQKNKKIIAFSSKNYSSETTDLIGNYCLSEIHEVFNKYYLGKGYTLERGIICSNKQRLLTKIKQSKLTSKHLTDINFSNIFGHLELSKKWLKLI